MRVPIGWLSEFFGITFDPEELAEKLTLRGLEVESVERVSPKFRGVLVAEILEVSDHPSKSDLKLVRIGLGEETYQVVSGAKNIWKGQKVPYAPPSSYLPVGGEVREKEISGVLSYGMICSEMELGLTDHASGILILPEDLKVGSKLEDWALLYDAVLDISTPPNRGDVLSIIGVAREVAPIVGCNMIYPEIENYPEDGNIEDYISLEVHDLTACPRYVLRIIKDVEIRESPLYVKLRLIQCGMRPINAVVDVTNYVMLELGQPLHAFDYELLSGRKIQVKLSRETFGFYTLDGEERLIEPGDLLICDGEGPVAIAGIMGGKNSEIRESTKIVALESAFFDPKLIMRTSRRLGIKSEASLRFERGVDFENVDLASKRAISLMRELASGRIVGGSLEKKRIPERKLIYLSIERLNSVLGTELDKTETARTLSTIGIRSHSEDERGFYFLIPSFRHDISEYMDLIEEVARLKGYDKIPLTLPKIETRGIKRRKKDVLKERIKDYFASAGFYEVINFSFFSEKDLDNFLLSEHDERRKALRIRNPISREYSLMRTFLTPCLLRTLSYNISRGEKNLRIYEMGHIFIDTLEPLPIEKTKIAFALTGRERDLFWKEKLQEYDYYDLKGVLEGLFSILRLDFQLSFSFEPFLKDASASEITSNGKILGFLGELKDEVLKSYEIEQRVYVCEIDLDGIFERASLDFKVRPISKYPYATRDFSFYVDDQIPVGTLIDRIKSISPLVSSVQLFDVYRKEKRSVTFRVFFQSNERTLTQEEINSLQERIISELTRMDGVSIRT